MSELPIRPKSEREHCKRAAASLRPFAAELREGSELTAEFDPELSAIEARAADVMAELATALERRAQHDPDARVELTRRDGRELER